MIKLKYILFVSPLLLCGCWGSKYVSADPSLEEIYVGKTYYDIESDFGRPDVTVRDDMEGSKATYYSASLTGSRAANLYKERKVRNRRTKENGAPEANITFSFKPDMRCYAVDSDFQLERVKEVKKPQPKPWDRSKPIWTKPQLPRTLDFPDVEKRSLLAKVISIEKIEMDKYKTTVHFMYKARTPIHRPVIDSGIFINSDVYIEDMASGHRYKMLEVDGISLYPKSTKFAHNIGGYDVLIYSITFQALPAETEFINIIEPGHSSFNFYKVDVRKPNALIEQEKQKTNRNK